jgi:hypothetical protein
MGEDPSGWGGELYAAADLVTPMAIRVAATLRLADHIAAGRRSAEALTGAVDADPAVLGRLLEHLVTAGVLGREADGGYALTARGEYLRDDHPDRVRGSIDLDGALGRADLCVVQLLHTVRTGQPSYALQFGQPFWEDLAESPERAASFDALMGARLAADLPAITAAYPWGGLGHLVDVGGGNGSLLLGLLGAHPELRGTVVDLAGPVARADAAIAAAGLTERADTLAGSFFDVLPAGAGGYLLSGVLCDWSDDEAIRILRRCAEAVGPTGRVVVLEHVGSGGSTDTAGDLRMLSLAGGRDRTLDQLRALAAAVGLTVGRVAAARSRTVLELLP